MTLIYTAFIAFWHTRKYYKSSTQTKLTHKTIKNNKMISRKLIQNNLTITKAD